MGELAAARASCIPDLTLHQTALYG
jgi:hypothetical protein